jgi:hypothetical protein
MLKTKMKIEKGKECDISIFKKKSKDDFSHKC